jgi:hypothetical protein
MENFVSNYILGFCDYLDKTGDYEFADRIMSKIANPLQENVRIASKDLYSPEEVLQKFINYRFAEETEGSKSTPAPAIIDSIDKAGKKAARIAAQKAAWLKFVSNLMKAFPKLANSIALFKNFGGPLISAIFVAPNAVHWIQKVNNEGFKEAFDTGKEWAEFGSFASALVGVISAFMAAGTSPTVVGGLSFAAISTVLFGISAACYILSLALPNNDDPYDNLPADKKPKPQKTSPSPPKEKASEPSKPSEPSRPSKRPSEPSSRPSRPRTPSVDSKEEKTINDLRDIQKGMGSISF